METIKAVIAVALVVLVGLAIGLWWAYAFENSHPCTKVVRVEPILFGKPHTEVYQSRCPNKWGP